MKKIYLISVLLIFSKLGVGQVTNTFPSNGNVGIGTLNPGANISFKGVNEGSEARGITWYSDRPEAYGIFRTSGDWIDPNYQQLKLAWETGIILNPGKDYVKSFVDIQGGGLRVTSGNVGIGTNSPIVPLQVDGTAIIVNPLGNHYNENLRLPSSNGGFSCIALGAVAGINGTGFGQWSLIKFPTDQQSKFSIRHNETDYLNILTNGYVGIGTDSPKEMLSVNGKIRAHEIKVETANWPDYVFKPDYQLIPLAELESFVKTHNHLPEIPSAASIESEGLLLGEMNKKMMRKIEEMTLYIIDQQKLIQEQNKRLEKLEQLINNKK